MNLRRNKYFIFVFILTLIFLFFFFLTSETVSYALFSFTSSNSYPTQNDYLEKVLTFDTYMIEGFKPMQFLMPVLVSTASLGFLYEKKGFLFHFFTLKQEKYQKALMKRLLFYSLVISIIIFGAFVVFWIIGVIIFPKVNDPNGPFYYTSETFSDIMGMDFYLNHRYGFYLAEGFLKCIPFAFIYSLISMCIGLITDKKYLSVLVPTLFYFLLIPLVSSLPIFKLKDYLYPNTIFVVGSMEQPSTIALFLAFVLPIVLIIVMLIKIFFFKERVGVS